MSPPAPAAVWETAPLGEVVDILDSRRIPVNSKERAKRVGDVPYYGATGQVGWIDSHIFDEELVLLGEDGAPFLDSAKPKAYLIRGESWVNNHAHVLRGRPGLLNSFLFHQLNCIDYRPYVSGTTRLKLPQGPMKQIPLLVPREDEQRRIVAEIEKQFTRLEAGVVGLRRVQANLKRYRAAVLKAACEGKLVPTEAELARQESRSYETGTQLLARILTERRQKWTGRGKYTEPAAPDTANLPSVPEGWTWATVEQVSTKVVDGVHKKPNYVPTGIPFVTVRNLTAGPGISFDKLNYVAPADHAEFLKRANPEQGDILVSKDGTLGVIRVIKADVEFSIFVSVALVKPVLKGMSSFLGTALSSPQVQAQMVPKGSGLQHIHLEDLRADCVPVPPLNEQERIVAEVERRLSVVEELEAVVAANLQRTQRLRQAILQHSFSGRLSRDSETIA